MKPEKVFRKTRKSSEKLEKVWKKSKNYSQKKLQVV